jgi:hypothetical protein
MSHSQFHCIAFILRHAWLSLWDKRMTTGRINQITILKPSRRDYASSQTRKLGLPKYDNYPRGRKTQLHWSLRSPRTCAFVICNQLGQSSQSADENLKCSLQAISLDANLLRLHAEAQAKQDLRWIDWQTLFTHNHTIICVSLWEGLTYSSCARRAEALCHKKDCCEARALRFNYSSSQLYIFIHCEQFDQFSLID